MCGEDYLTWMNIEEEQGKEKKMKLKVKKFSMRVKIAVYGAINQDRTDELGWKLPYLNDYFSGAKVKTFDVRSCKNRLF